MQTNNKLREALVEIIDYLEPIRKWTMPSKENRTRLTALFAAVDTVYTKAKNALAEPVKNCEVGTVAQQAKRFTEYCESEVCKRKRCKSRAKALCIERCALAWAQMPYKEGETK